MTARINIVLTIGILLLAGATARPADANPDAKEIQALVDKAVGYLKKSQRDDGSFSAKLGGPGISALVAAGLIRNGHNASDPLVSRTLEYMEKSVRKDGGVYDKGLANYTTCVALIAFKEANAKGKYDKIIDNGTKFLKTMQDDSAVQDPKFGGVSYDGKKSPDLSNTQFFVEAMLAAGVPKDDPAVQRALKFINRCQNLPGETNDQPFAKKTTEDDKGGFTYSPIIRDKDPNATGQGGLRSSGTMTYAGLKSFIHAGVTKDDPRVKAAIDWMRRHYTLDANPGLGSAGLFYYYHTFAKAMSVLGDDEFADAKGAKHNWRRDLFEALKKRQNADGSWANENTEFFENNPDLATAYALMALSYCKK